MRLKRVNFCFSGGAFYLLHGTSVEKKACIPTAIFAPFWLRGYFWGCFLWFFGVFWGVLECPVF
jgi:hypothetical protein